MGRWVSVVVAVAVLSACCFTGCKQNTNTTSNNETAGPSASIMTASAVFGDTVKTSHMQYSISGADKLKTGKILNKSYWKLIDKKVVLKFNFDEAFLNELENKDLLLMIEYYESTSKAYNVTYTNGTKDVKGSYTARGTNCWGGKTIRISDFKHKADSDCDFSIQLDTANQLWIAGVRAVAADKSETKYPQLISTKYATSNGIVINANVKDYGAIGDGIFDDSLAFQTALSDIVDKGYGVIYVPAGTYKLTQEMVVPSGVSIVGDFNSPDKKKGGVCGTVLAVYPATEEESNDNVFFQMNPNSCLKGLTVWYPEQTLKNGAATAYPYTVGISEMVGITVQDIFLVNSYKGIDNASRSNNQQTVRNIYGTTLSTGIIVNTVNDINRYENMDFSPEWWLNSGLDGTPDKTVLNNWMMKYSTAFQMGGIDWHFLSDLTVSGYKTGISLKWGFGKLYNLNIQNCNTCIYMESNTLYGSTLTNAVLKADGGSDPAALRLGKSFDDSMTCVNVQFESTGTNAVKLLGTGALVLQDCSVKLTGADGKAGISNTAGKLSVINTKFSGGTNSVYASKDALSSALTNCSSDGGLKYDVEDEAKLSVKNSEENKTASITSPATSYALQNRRPEKAKMFNAADYGVTEDSKDVSAGLQSAIDEAHKAGGGVVYVPLGAYRLESPLVVKTGVELSGSCDLPHYISAPSTFFITDYGKNQENGKALISLEENSGIRGFSISYDKISLDNLVPYAYTIRGLGNSVYVANIAVAAAYQVIDFATNQCDNHYVESLNFYSFKTGIAVGHGSKNGVIRDVQSNPAAISENPHTTATWDAQKVIEYGNANLTGFSISDTVAQTLYFTFIYGTLNGVEVKDNADVYVIGHGTDYSTRDVYLSGNGKAVFTDAQLSGALNSYAILTSDDYTGTADFFNSTVWAIRITAAAVKGGTVRLNSGVFFQCGASPVVLSGGNATASGLVIIQRSFGDFTAESGAKSLCAFGNIYTYGKKLQNTSGAKISGSDLK